MKKVLQISGTMNLGGQETFIMNLYKNIDRNLVQFDFIVNGEKEGFYEKEIRSLGGNIFHITPMSKNVIKHFFELRKIIKDNNYTAVHRHSSTAIAFIDLFAAKSCGVHSTIFHSHSTNVDKNRFLHFICRFFVNIFSRYKFACSHGAGKFMYGNSKFDVVPNGIEIERFAYSKIKRKKIRKELNISNDSFVIGHVGRFTYAKNHPYIFKIFSKVYESIGDSAYLILVGDGINKNDILSAYCNEKYYKNVLVLSNRNDVDCILDGMDVFVFPSHYEGLPVSIVEAQASNLPIIMSNNISDDTIIDPSLIKKVSIADDNINEWVDFVINIKDNGYIRGEKNERVNCSTFNIKNVAAHLLKVYLSYEK